jgi:selenocysteine lyase/cysteine desulfurase
MSPDPKPAFDPSTLADEFPVEPGLLYLNHAGVAPWPRRAQLAVERFARANVRRGATDYADWLRLERELREQLRALINAPAASDIALVKNTSEALSFVANGIDWRPGDRIVSAAEEFPSNRVVWQALASRGVSLERVRLDGCEDPEAALVAACSDQTRLLAISSVQYASGLRLDLGRLGAFCRQSGILFCVDAIQSAGAAPFDVQAAQCDFAMADGHKWLLGPEGLGFFFIASRVRDRIALSEYGWHMLEDPDDFDAVEWVPAQSARRFECGSPNLLGAHALAASLSLILEVGIGEISKINVSNSLYLIDKLKNEAKVDVLSPDRPERLAGIVTFRPAGIHGAELVRGLRQAGVICAYRGGGVRFSPDFYQPRAFLDASVDRLLSLMTERA